MEMSDLPQPHFPEGPSTPLLELYGVDLTGGADAVR